MQRSAILGIVALATAMGTASAADKGTVVVVGSGQSGQPMARILVDQGYDVRVMTRNPAKASGLPAAAKVVAGDATRPETLGPALQGADYVIATIGAACERDKPFPAGASPEDIDYRGIEKLAQASKAAGVRQFVMLSSIGAGNTDPKAPLNSMCGMVLEWKGKGEDALRNSGVPYTIVRPGGLKPFPGQPACQEGVEPLSLNARDSIQGGVVCRADVALVMADALGNTDALGKTVELKADKSLAIDAWRSAWASLPKD
jgi:uncharacterized protein YbjT (DUF2867 family)